jgi:hypothetical protein
LKELLVYPWALHISVLVPKRRGEGYLKMPFGHHVTALSEVERQVGYDLWGLDGSLDIQVQPVPHEKDKLLELLERIIPPIATHYGMTWRLVEHDEYIEKHPIKTC